MDLIERYIEAVTELLPDDKKQNAATDLRTRINALLPPNPGEDDINDALQQLGSPREAAGLYTDRKRYLIGPDYYDSYIALLKLISGILLCVMAGITVLTWIISPPDGGAVDFFTDLFGNMVNGALGGLFWVTIVFAILERTNVAVPSPDEDWKPADLIKDGALIPRSDSVASILFTVIFVALLFFRPEIISFYFRSEAGSWTLVPLFDLDQLSRFMPLILLSGLFEIGLSTWKFIVKRWNGRLAVANLLQNIINVIITIILLWNRTIINPDFSKDLAALTNFSAVVIDRSLNVAIWVIIGLTILGAIIDSIKPFVTGRRQKRYAGQ